MDDPTIERLPDKTVPDLPEHAPAGPDPRLSRRWLSPACRHPQVGFVLIAFQSVPQNRRPQTQGEMLSWILPASIA